MTIEVDYRFPAGVDAQKQAKIIAVGQTAGTWNARFTDREAALKSHLGEVISVETDIITGQSIATIRFPEKNVENDVSSLLTMIFGKYSMAGAAKVIAVRLPQNYGLHPKFGITGIREKLGVFDRPLIMAIFKPALGLSARDHAGILKEVAFAGLDIIKDDEILGDLDVAPTLERLKACRPIIEAVKQETGRTVLYAVNVTGSADKLLDKARLLVREGANALLLNVLSYGFSVLQALAADAEINVPIFTHPALAGAMCAAPNYGMSYSVVLGTLMAHAGADAVLYPAHYGSLPFDELEETRIKDILRDRNVFPVPSAGIHPGIVPKAVGDYGRDVILNAGTGIMDHPDDAASGVKAFFAALERVEKGESFEVQPPSVDEMMSRINSVLQNLPWLVCERNGEILGYVYAAFHRQRAAYQWSVEVSVYIREAARRSGIGQALYTSLFKILVLQGYFNAYAGMTLPNPGSVRLHEKMGFKPVGTYHKVGYKNGAWRDVAWCQLLLQPLVSNPEKPQNINIIRNSIEFESALESGMYLLN